MDKNIFEFKIDKIVIPDNQNNSIFSSHLKNLSILFPTDETIHRYVNIRKYIL